MVISSTFFQPVCVCVDNCTGQQGLGASFVKSFWLHWTITLTNEDIPHCSDTHITYTQSHTTSSITLILWLSAPLVCTLGHFSDLVCNINIKISVQEKKKKIVVIENWWQ